MRPSMAARTKRTPMIPPAMAPIDVCFLLADVVEPSAPEDVGAESSAIVPEEEGSEPGTEDFEDGWKSCLSPGSENPLTGSTLVALPSGLKVM